MKENVKKHYEAPQLTVVTFKAERGYASSGGGAKLLNTLAISSLYQNEGYQTLEDRGTTNSWTW